MNKYLEELTQRRADIEDWMKKLQESTNMNIRNQNASLKNLETQVEQLTKGYQSKFANEVPNSSMGNLDASVNIMPYSMFKCLKLTSLKKTSMLVEMADMSKKAPMGTVENVLVKIDKFVFPTDFVIIDMLGDPNETMILGEDRIMFDINENIHHPAIPVEKVYMANSVQEEESFNPLEINKVRNKKIDDTTRAKRYNEWFAENNKHYNYGNTSLPYLGDYTIAPGRITNPDDMRNLILSIQSYFLNSS
ncbi:putative reverse transcriptase domain-containing protein [Tanacetum coccineum]